MSFSFSVICPTYNEINYISQFFDFIESVSVKPLELIVVDGMSNDGTRDFLRKKCETLPYLKVLYNERKTVPFALNLAIPICKGDIIIRLDAHTKYALDYFDQILETFKKIDADIVGGPTRTASQNSVQEAIAYMFNTSLGMGNSSVHDVTYEGYTDSVTFGAWKRDLFEKTGLFDISLKRNQDDEFHYRAKSMGFKIYQNPAIQLFYYPRSSFLGLFKQYFEYGLYKPMVLKKIKTEVKLRHLIPALFVTYLILVISLFCFLGSVLLIPLILYFILDLLFTLKSKKSLIVQFCILLSYPTVHIGYGIGFILGLFK